MFFLGGYNEHISQSIDGRNKSLLTNFAEVVNGVVILNAIQILRMLLG